MQHDQDVLSFLRQRNAPLTNANYNSVKAQLDAHPELRPSKGASVAEDSAEHDNPDGKAYDGGVDSLGRGASIKHNSVSVEHGSDDAQASHVPNGATREAGPATNAAGDGSYDSHSGGSNAGHGDSDYAVRDHAQEHIDQVLHLPDAIMNALPGMGTLLGMGGGAALLNRWFPGAGGGGSANPASAGVAGGVAGGASGGEAAPASGGAGGAGVEPSPDVSGAAGGASVLDGHAPQATPAPGQAGGVDPMQRIAQLQADRFASDNGMPAAGSPAQSFSQMAAGGRQPGGPTPLLGPPTGSPTDGMVLPGVAPSSPAHPYPDNAPHGMMDVVSKHIQDLVGAGRMNEAKQLIMTLARQIHGL